VVRGQRGFARALVVIGAASVLVVGATSGSSSGARLKAARAATATARAYRIRDLNGTHGYVSASGDETGSVRGASASASTSGGHGNSNASVHLDHVSLFSGLIRASGVSVHASANGGGNSTGGRVSNLEIAGSKKGSVTSKRTYDIGGFARVVVLGEDDDGIAAIRVKLTRENLGMPAGSTVVLAFATAAASDAVAGASAPARQPASKSNGSGSSRAGNHHSSSTKSSGAGAPSPPPAPRRVPRQVRLLNTKRGFTFPVYGPHNYVDTFGAFRADTGFHQGNDIFAAAGTPVVAVTTGRLFNVGTLKISGNRLWVRSDKGDCFFYAHLSAFATDARDSLRVKAGQVVGFVGSTGDAERTPSHLHFEVHPGCGPAVDPYPFLRAWEGRRDVPAAAWLVQYARDSGRRPGALVELKDYLAAG